MPAQNVIDVSTVIEKQKLSRFLVRLVLVSWIVTFFDGFDTNVIAFAAPYLAPRFHLNKMMMGNVFGATLFGAIFGAFLFGYLGDKLGRRRAIILATACFGVLTLGLALASGYHYLLVLRFLGGIALGGFLPLIWALNIEYSPKRYRSTLVTINMVGYSFGQIVGGPLAVWLIPKFGWTALFIFGGGLTLIATLVLLALLPESIRFLVSTGRRPDLIERTVRQIEPQRLIAVGTQFVLSDEGAQGKKFRPSFLFAGELRWITPLLWLSYFCGSLVTFGMFMWMPMLLESLRFTHSDAALATSVTAFTAMLSGLVVMRFTDKHGAIALIGMPALATPLLVIFGFINASHAVLLTLLSLVTFFVLGGQNGMHSIAGIFYPSSFRSNGTGWASAIAKIGATSGPILGGFLLSSRMPPQKLYAVLAFCPAIMVVCLYVIGHIHSRILGREALEGSAVTVEPQHAVVLPAFASGTD